jgi:hypothetical protein
VHWILDPAFLPSIHAPDAPIVDIYPRFVMLPPPVHEPKPAIEHPCTAVQAVVPAILHSAEPSGTSSPVGI